MHSSARASFQKSLLFLLILLMLSGCSSLNKVNNIQHKKSSTYLLQHSGVLSIAEKRMPLHGMLQLMPEQRKAQVVMMNEMGMKLLVAEIIADDKGGYESKKIFESPFLRLIPHFYNESMSCIYEMFLAPQSATSGAINIVTEGSRQIADRKFAAHTIITDPQGNYTLELFLNSGSQKDF
ncbi:lipoprotein [Maridesulfovibrio sp.]|uniref:lipoprotein n=1 Tax=Maridesulfovibrio sp. TaxID=2795000 RepID=UPI0029C9F786|nr:lipoprotein [Maridesulfovibrio sp.]